MGREIEFKIPLNPNQYDFIKQMLDYPSKNKNLNIFDIKDIYKKDEYYSQYLTEEERIKNKEVPVIRLRTENNNKTYFTVKSKSYENGIEVNSENETYVENADAIRSFFTLTGFNQWFYKEKKALSFYAYDIREAEFIFHCELVTVNNLTYFEIESTNLDLEKNRLIEKMNKFISFFNLDPKNKDSRTWVQIIKENSIKLL